MLRDCIMSSSYFFGKNQLDYVYFKFRLDFGERSKKGKGSSKFFGRGLLDPPVGQVQILLPRRTIFRELSLSDDRIAAIRNGAFVVLGKARCISPPFPDIVMQSHIKLSGNTALIKI